MKSLKNLEVLAVRGCPNLTDRCIDSIGGRVRCLDVRATQSYSEDGILELVDRLEFLNVLALDKGNASSRVVTKLDGVQILF